MADFNITIKFGVDVISEIGLPDITSGNIPVVGNGKLLDSQVSAESIVGSMKTIYLNKQTNDSQSTSDFRYKNTSRGMVVVLPVKGEDGELLELADKHIKISFWLNLIRDSEGNELNDLSVFQFYNLCVEYKKGGVITYAWLNLRLAQGFFKRAQVKDLYGKVNEALIAGNVTWSAAVLGASEESALVSNSQVIDATIELNTTTPSYTVVEATPESIKVSADVVGCSVLLPTGTLEADKVVNVIIPDNSEEITVGDKIAKPGDTAFCFYDFDSDSWVVNTTSSTVEVVDYSDVFVVDAFKTADLTIAGGGKLTYTTVVPTAAVGELIAFLEVIGSYPSSYFFPGIYEIVQKDTVAKFIRVRKVVDDFSQSSVVRVSAPTYRGMWQSIYSGFADELPTFERLSDKLEISDLDNFLQKSDVVDNLASTAYDKPLSAFMGKSLYDLYQSLVIAVSKKVDFDTNSTIQGQKTFLQRILANAGAVLTGAVSFVLGSDALGDMYYRKSDGDITRLPIGSNGQVLTSQAGLPVWATVSSGGTSASTLSMLNIGLTGTLATSWVDATLSQMSLDGDPKLSLIGNTFECTETGNYIILAKISINKDAPKYGHSIALYDNTTSSYVFVAMFPPQYDSLVSQSLGDGSISGVWGLTSGHSYSVRGLVDSLAATYTNLARISIINPRFQAGSSATTASYIQLAKTGSIALTTTLSKVLLVQDTNEDASNKLNGGYEVVDNRIRVPEAGRYRLIAEMGYKTASSEISVTITARKYNTTKYGNYYALRSSPEYTKDATFGANIAFSEEFVIGADEIIGSASPTGIELALIGNSNQTLTLTDKIILRIEKINI